MGLEYTRQKREEERNNDPVVKEGRQLFDSLPQSMKVAGYMYPVIERSHYTSAKEANSHAGVERSESEGARASVLVTFTNGKKIELNLNYGMPIEPAGETREESDTRFYAYMQEQIGKIVAGAKGVENIASVEGIWSLGTTG